MKNEPESAQERWAVWWQFPRRIMFLVLAYGLALLLITSLGLLLRTVDPPNLGQKYDWSMSKQFNKPVAEMLETRIPNTLLLLGATLGVALLLMLILSTIAVRIHLLETKVKFLGVLLQYLGKFCMFVWATPPIILLGIMLLAYFSIYLQWLPPGGMSTLDNSERLRHFFLPTLTLAIFPSVLSAQVMTRELTIFRAHAGFRLWLKGLLKGVGSLWNQIGGLLSGLFLVEVVFFWPGIGRLFINAAVRQDFPILLAVFYISAGVILVGRLIAELFHWLERLVGRALVCEAIPPAPWRKTTHKIWSVLALLFLLPLLWMAVSGLFVDPDAVQRIDLHNMSAPPSTEHLLGTDELGRDLLARISYGGFVTLAMASTIAGILLLPAGLIGALTGTLASRRTVWSESLADLFLLPADVLLFFPAVPMAIAITLVLGKPNVRIMILATAIVLLPRAFRVVQTLWMTAPTPRRRFTILLAGVGSLFFGTMFFALWTVAALDFLGFAVQHPLLSLSTLMKDHLDILFKDPATPLTIEGLLWICPFTCYIIADALIGFFSSKDVMTHLNQ